MNALKPLNHKVFLASIALLFAILACGDGFGEVVEDYIKEAPQTDDVAGLYNLTYYGVSQDSLDDLTSSSIQLYSDGTCLLSNIPMHTDLEETYELTGYYSGSCEWEVVPMEDGKDARLGICFKATDFVSPTNCAYLLKHEEEPFRFVFRFEKDPYTPYVMVFTATK